MTVVDLHPDDLLDRRAKGLLAEEESKRLHEHLRHCAVCRLELQLREDFREEFAPYAQSASVQRFVLDALSAAGTPAMPLQVRDQGVAHGEERAPARRKWQRRLLAPLAATLLFVTGLAAAQYTGLATTVALLARRAFTEADVVSAHQSQAGAPARTDSVAQRQTRVGADDNERSAAQLPASSVDSAALPNAPAETKRQKHVVRSTSVAGQAKTNAARVTAVASQAAHEADQARGAPDPAPQGLKQAAAHADTSAGNTKAEPVAEATASAPAQLGRSAAAKLFAEANLARRQGRWLEASELYGELRARHGESPEARLSTVLLARMQLDQGDAAAALRGFDTYLATADGALHEEALTGRCMALGKLGRRDEERATLRQLLARYPDSPYARKAEKRLGAEAEP